MTTYVLRNGELVDKAQAEPLARARGPQVITDTMDGTWHPCDGRVYDSKSRFRAETRARGCIEVGNETIPDRRWLDTGNRRADIVRAIQHLGGR